MGDNALKNVHGGGTCTQRNSNLELFRIITMLLIVAHHYVVNSGLMAADGPVYADPCSAKSLFLLVFGAWGKTGINCFVFITGYFMCKSRISFKKFVKLILEIQFYKITINTVFWITGYQSFSWVGLVKALLPITQVELGFTSAYLCFYLCIPFLNILVQNLSEKQHVKLLALMSFIYIFFETMKVLKIFSVTMNYVSWFAVLYLIASYIRLYPKPVWNNKRVWVWMTVVFVGLSAASVVACAWLGSKMVGKQFAYIFVVDSNTFLAVMTAISAFMLFKNLNLKNSRVINKIAGSTFGVLLIHAGGAAMRQWLWGDVIRCVEMYQSEFLIPFAILSVLAIFVICTVIDQLRVHLLERPFFRMFDKHLCTIEQKYYKTEKAICIKLGIDPSE